MTENPLDQALSRTERIAVVGSPSSTSGMEVDVLGKAAEKQLIGAFVFFKYIQEGCAHCGLGQISEVSLRNVWAEDATMKGLIRLKGQVDPVTGRQDVHTAKLSVGAVFSVDGSKFTQSNLGTVPPTGTTLHLVDDEFLNTLLEPFLNELVYLGKTYGSRTLLPMWFRHFGRGPGGLGEAYHLGVFGKTGSGKSFLSKMVLLAYAKHTKMSIIVIDPQGEFTKNSRPDGILGTELSKLKCPCELHGVGDIVLPGTNEDLFKRILISSRFLQGIGVISEDNLDRGANAIVNELWEMLRRNHEIQNPKRWQSIERAHKRECFDAIWRCLGDPNWLVQVYSGLEYRQRVMQAVQTVSVEDKWELWSKVTRLFSGDQRGRSVLLSKIAQMVSDGRNGRNVVVIDLSRESVPDYLFWNDEIQIEVLNELFEQLTREAEKQYREGLTCNTLVILDEAHRFAPRGQPIGQPEEITPAMLLKHTLIDCVKTTRKYGLGWMFISQTLSGLDQEILNQLRVYLIGFGLGWGSEYRSLRELIGGNEEAIRLYQGLRDPQSSIGDRAFPFMALGPVSPLSFSGSPLFFNALEFPKEFGKVNVRLFK